MFQATGRWCLSNPASVILDHSRDQIDTMTLLLGDCVRQMSFIKRTVIATRRGNLREDENIDHTNLDHSVAFLSRYVIYERCALHMHTDTEHVFSPGDPAVVQLSQ